MHMIEAEDSNVQNKSTNRDDAGGEGGVGEKGESHMKFFPSGTTSLCLSLFLQYRTALILYYFFVQSSNFYSTLLLHLSVREGCEWAGWAGMVCLCR